MVHFSFNTNILEQLYLSLQGHQSVRWSKNANCIYTVSSLTVSLWFSQVRQWNHRNAANVISYAYQL